MNPIFWYFAQKSKRNSNLEWFFE